MQKRKNRHQLKELSTERRTRRQSRENRDGESFRERFDFHKNTLLASVTALALVAPPALLAGTSPAIGSLDSDEPTVDQKSQHDEWHIEPADHWRNSVDAEDERILGYVVSVDYPKFTLRTHDQGVMNFMIPITSEYADDLRTGNRIQVWFDTEDAIDDDDDVWFVAKGYGVNADDAKANRTILTDDPSAVQNTALPPGSKAGPGPNAYTLMGTITDVMDNAIVLDTVVGPRVVRIVEQTSTNADLQVGNEIAVEFHRGDALIHAKVIHEAEDYEASDS